jgi:hypothetical protein
MNKLQGYINRHRNKENLRLNFKGHLIVKCGEAVVFDRHNLIVNQGKGAVMDLLASLGFSPSYTPKPFNAIVLTKNQTAEALTDTFATKVYTTGTNQISNEGVLHVETAYGGQVAVTHTQGSLSIQFVGTIGTAYGNDPTNNHINSVCLCTGINPGYGGPGQAAYSASGNERLFARVNVGDLVKESSKNFSFTWLLTVS